MPRTRLMLEKTPERRKREQELRMNKRTVEMIAYRLALMDESTLREQRRFSDRERLRAKHGMETERHDSYTNALVGMSDYLYKYTMTRAERNKKEWKEEAKGNALITDFVESSSKSI